MGKQNNNEQNLFEYFPDDFDVSSNGKIQEQVRKFRLKESKRSNKSIKDNENRLKLNKIRNNKYKEIKGLDSKLLDLYVTEVDYVLKQTFDMELLETSYYLEYNGNRKLNSYFIFNNLLKKHILQEETIGIFANREYEYTKFITFDVDTMDKIYLNELVSVLKSMGITEDSILVSSSGDKGYHLDLFFEKNNGKYPTVNTAQNFYYKVISAVQNNMMKINKEILMSPLDKVIEFRPTGYTGCKLPCGKHLSTNNFCNLFETSDLKEEVSLKDSLERLNKIKKINIKNYMRIVNNEDANILKKKLKSDFIINSRDVDVPNVLSKYKHEIQELKKSGLNNVEKNKKRAKIITKLKEVLSGEVLTTSEIVKYKELVGEYFWVGITTEDMLDHLSIETIESIKDRKLVTRGCRHTVTHESLFYFVEIENHSVEQAIDITKELILNSDLYKGKQLQFALKEVERLSNYIKKSKNKEYGTGYDTTLTDVDVEEILELFKSKRITINQLYLVLALKKATQLKDTNVDMECSYSYLLILANRRNKVSQQAVSRMLYVLEKESIIQIKNKKDRSYNIDNGKLKKETNRIDFLILNNPRTTEDVEYVINNTEDFLKHIANKYSKNYLKTVFSASTYDRQIKNLVNKGMEDEK